jgi:hypothetical protein
MSQHTANGCYSRRHQIPCFKATEGLHPPYRAAVSHKYSVSSFATLRVLSCLHSPGFRCSCCDVVRFFCDLEACNLVTATIVRTSRLALTRFSGILKLYDLFPQFCWTSSAFLG